MTYKKCLNVLFIFVFSVITCLVNVSAEEVSIDEKITVEISYIINNIPQDYKLIDIGVTPYYPFGGLNGVKGHNIPNQTWEFNNSGRYNMSGASSYHDLYTNWNFKDASTMDVAVTPYKVGSIDVEVYKKNFLFGDSLITSFTAKYISGQTTTTLVAINGLNPSSKYYVKLKAPCYFTGYVDKIN